MQEPNQRFLHTQKHTCDSLSPYVGIIQIRFWVKAIRLLSARLCEHPVFSISYYRLYQFLQSYDISFSVIHTIRVMMRCFQQQFYYTHAQKKCKCLFISAISIHFFKKYSDAHLRAYVNTFLSSPALRGYDARIY